MRTDWLTAQEAAERLGISVLTLYDWLAQSNRGKFMLRGQAFSIDYLQGGRRGQGRIRIEADEIDRMLDAMRVKPRQRPRRRVPMPQQHYPGITVKLGYPGQ
ncbi:helix-turn-helix domain-containing protein [Rubinisphaera margarita]|uniref:helix-turn-helix domain-containing protein n=1 Tax=Rubinisphaera margarita TaxID=2909586 RepID=UPI001EE94642|nr:helix-turn-helix domain-containing protein [Rubinisphaera margarita]MCG6157272.1 helix-turn-helix domain-containing protein [Rubinisphaera margarita]